MIIATVRTASRRSIVECRRSFLTSSETQNYSIKKVLPYSPELIYSVVSNVEHYSQFLPYCHESTITQYDTQSKPKRAILKVGWKQFEETFESHVECSDNTVTARVANEHPLFTTLYTQWSIHPIPNQDKKCVVDFQLQFAFRNPIYNTVSKSFGPTLANIMVKAFRDRAHDLHA
ncbi:coenzyme Q-binding protein Coq10p, mitochondrial [Trichomonascus vanleenenianus]|uniref:ubiquinone-binding protein COQ10 n=1 Tax=Trichomonascus vanleenenianus TaxID=2268995 RepID=UPI003ECA592A